MAIVSNTLLTFSAIGNREDLIDKIYNISPVEVPVQSMADETTAKGVLHEWQTESLNTAAANAQLQGDDVAFGAAILTTRVGNRTQISRKEVVVSGTQEAVDKAGRNSEMVRQMANKRAELKRDIEFVLCSNQAPVTGNSTTAPQLRPMLSWYATNVSGGTSAANGSASTARTDGTQRTFTEALMTAQMQNAWINGGKPSVLLCGPKQRAVVSTFSGGATKFYQVEDKKLTATITVYDGDFGTLKIVPSRFVRGGQTGADREVQILDPSLVAIAYLPGRKFKTLDIATTGDALKGAVLAEYTLEMRNEAGCALVADLT
jgi:hypothetical protein